jgi:hypothetical protein
MPFGAPLEADRVATARKMLKDELKRKIRTAKKRYATINRLKALPVIRNVYIRNDYVNPVTLNKIPSGPTVYHVKDSRTGRVDYYDKATFWRLMPKNIKNNYNLLMADPQRPLFKNPLTRTNVKTRNVQRVRVKPAGAKIAKAIKKHISKKKKARKSH